VKVDVPMIVSVVDQVVSLFGHTCFYKGKAKLTYRTVGFLLINIGNNRTFTNNRIIIIAQYVNDINYALKGSIYYVGSCIEWLMNRFGLVSDPQSTDSIVFSLKDNRGVYFITSLVGLLTPYWNSDSKGAFFGLSIVTSKGHLIRTVLEGIAYRVCKIVELIKDYGFNTNYISVDGGVSKNNFLMQFQTDLLGIKIKRPFLKEITSLGCFYLAGLKSGIWYDLFELKKLENIEKKFSPKESNEKEIQ